MASSPLIYSAFAATLLWLIRDELARVTKDPRACLATAYVDDHLLVFDETLLASVEPAISGLLHKLAVPFSVEKVQRGPRVRFIGYDWDLSDRTLHIEEQKRTSLIARVDALLATRQCTLSEGESLAGALQFSLVAAPPARAYLAWLYRAIWNCSADHRYIRVGQEGIKGLSVIRAILQGNPGRAQIHASPDVIIFSDASLNSQQVTGHAGFYALFTESRSIRYAHFPIPVAACNIQQRSGVDGAFTHSSGLFESVGVGIALQTLIAHGLLQGASVLVACDNKGVSACLNSGRGVTPSTNAAMLALLHTIAPAGLTIAGVHLPRSTPAIQLADSLSRGDPVPLQTAFKGLDVMELRAHPEQFPL
jgi:hypothetical protein